MHIDDISDPSRSITIQQVCNCKGKEYSCRSWLKIQKLLYFCGHALVKDIGLDNIDVSGPFLFSLLTMVHLLCELIRFSVTLTISWILSKIL